MALCGYDAPVLVLSALWLAAPVIAGGLLHVFAIRLNLLPSLAALPLDGGATCRGRRVFGDNKTVRGVVLMLLFTIVCALAQAWLIERFAWAQELTLPGMRVVPPWQWGALLGAGYILGELPNSFIKRQLEIAPGAPGRGRSAPFFWVLDQADSLIGTVVAMAFVWTPPVAVLIALFAVTLVVHPMVAGIMVMLGLKNRVG